MIVIILCAVALALFMSVVTTYIDAQTDINQAKENAKPHTYHIASVVKSNPWLRKEFDEHSPI